MISSIIFLVASSVRHSICLCQSAAAIRIENEHSRVWLFKDLLMKQVCYRTFVPSGIGIEFASISNILCRCTYIEGGMRQIDEIEDPTLLGH